MDKYISLELHMFDIHAMESTSSLLPKKDSSIRIPLLICRNIHAHASQRCVAWPWEEREMGILQTPYLCV